jgi:hypothetical protein
LGYPLPLANLVDAQKAAKDREPSAPKLDDLPDSNSQKAASFLPVFLGAFGSWNTREVGLGASTSVTLRLL